MYEVNKIGFEIEGEFSRAALERVGAIPGVDVVHDGSLRRCASGCSTLSLHELRCGPYEPGDRAIADIFKALKTGYHYNRTCGLHVHVSFKDGERKNVIAPSVFWSGFALHLRRALLRDWSEDMEGRKHNTFSRMYPSYSDRGLGDCSTPQGWDENNAPEGNVLVRYQFLNTASWLRHRTIEVRAFPATEPGKMLRMVEWTTSVFSKWLKREHPVVCNVVGDVPQSIVSEVEPEVVPGLSVGYEPRRSMGRWATYVEGGRASMRARRTSLGRVYITPNSNV